MRITRTLAAALLMAACDRSADARRAGELRHDGRTLAEWWMLRRSPSDATAGEARVAIRTLGPAAVPFLAAKAASHDLGDYLGGSAALEDLCPNALPAMEAARAAHPSPVLEAAIRRVRADAAARARADVCAPNGEPVRPEGQRLQFDAGVSR